MKNSEIAGVFRSIASILEIKGENVFRIRAYERAAQNIAGLSAGIEDLARADKLREIPGIGVDLAGKIKEYLESGKIKAYDELKSSVPEGLIELLEIPSVGPKTVKLLYQKLKIKNLSGLEKAIRQHKLRGLFGIKDKTIENIFKGIAILKKGRERMALGQAHALANEFIGALEKLPAVEKISAAGSLRRQKETVRDIDILMTSRKPKAVMTKFVRLAPVKEILAAGQTKSSVRTKDDVQVDCRVVEEKSFGAALLYFTGSKDFNIKLRQLAIKKGLKINEYGVFRGDKFIAGRNEEEIFKLLGLSFIPPELRENRGEIELAKSDSLPRLLTLKDIRGDLHAHSTWSDGGNSVEEMTEAARTLGYSYIAITDHSQGLKIAGGLSAAELKKKKSQIEKINKGLRGFKVLYAAEVDIDSAGRLDYRDEVLKNFDLVVAAIHSGFKQSREQLTKRVINACRNKYAHIIAHPTGRLWGTREAYDLDLEQVLRAAADTNTCLELNAFSQRLDLDSANCRRAKELGVRLALGSDAHSKEQLAAMKLGVAVARRGWLEPGDVINTFTLEELLKAVRK
ncbi:MAG: DNA polymerase III [Omnitrophica WOR_2 bacterium RIFCSPLOWO2_12_FULL_51_8]|nr:MAG: DNA polymerase III [Omnitrophica WOR_2 bacterium RIFCSPLOWO2_12_FULL_51_8]